VDVGSKMILCNFVKLIFLIFYIHKDCGRWVKKMILCNFVKLIFLIFYIHKDCGHCIKGVPCEIYDNKC
jgi:hypothetical protein